MIYFIRAGETENMKIGYTEDKETLNSRIRSLQTGNPYELILEGLIDGGYSEENILHNFFKDNRLNGEWFNIPEKVCVYEMRRIIIKVKYKSRKALIKKMKNKTKIISEETKHKIKEAIHKLLGTDKFIYSGNISEISKINKKDIKKHISFFKDLIDSHNKSIYDTDSYVEYINHINRKSIDLAISELESQGKKTTNVNIAKKTGLHVNTVSNNRLRKLF